MITLTESVVPKPFMRRGTRLIPYFSLLVLGVFFLYINFILSANSIFPTSAKNSSTPRVLFVLRTCPKYYGTRLRDALHTYLSRIPTSLILPVGNSRFVISAPYEGRSRFVNVLPTDEGKEGVVCNDNHSEGIVCIEGRALFYAYQKRKDFDWIFVIDDDVYVHVHNVHNTITSLDPTLPLVYSTLGCAPKVTCASKAGGGICGGGGYFLSRKSLEKTICQANATSMGRCAKEVGYSEDDLLKAWMADWMNIGKEVAKEDGGWWSDITAGCAFHQLGNVSSHVIQGIYAWELEAKEIVEKLVEEAPLSFHYVERGEMPGMKGIHKLVTGTDRKETANEHKMDENIVAVPEHLNISQQSE